MSPWTTSAPPELSKNIFKKHFHRKAEINLNYFTSNSNSRGNDTMIELKIQLNIILLLHKSSDSNDISFLFIASLPCYCSELLIGARSEIRTMSHCHMTGCSHVTVARISLVSFFSVFSFWKPAWLQHQLKLLSFGGWQGGWARLELNPPQSSCKAYQILPLYFSKVAETSL